MSAASAGVPTALPVTIDGGGPGSGSEWLIDAVRSGGDPCETAFQIPDAALDPDDGTIIGHQIDAFDGASLIKVDGAYVEADPGDEADVMGQYASVGPRSLAGLNVSVELFVLESDAVARNLTTLVNPTPAPIDATILFDNNWGSDLTTISQGTSSGDTTLTTADRWYVTSDDEVPDSDPVNVTAFAGPGSPAVTPTAISDAAFECSSSEGLRVQFDVTIPAGETRRLLFFHELAQTVATGLSAAADYDSNPAENDARVADLTDDELTSIVNWNFEVTPPVPDWYGMVETDGTVYAFPGTQHAGDAALGPNEVAVDFVINRAGVGYYVLSNLGIVHAIGPGSGNHGDLDPASLKPGERPVAMSLTQSGDGYWIFTNLGAAAPFGDAPDIGDVSDLALAADVVDAAPFAPGYYMTGRDGGVFTPPEFIGSQDVPFFGSVPGQLGGVPLNEAIVTIYVDGSDGVGYSLAAGDGGMFNFESNFCGSIPGILPGVPLNQPVVNAVPWGECYIFFAADGGAFAFGPKPFLGSLGENPPDTPIVSGDSFFG